MYVSRIVRPVSRDSPGAPSDLLEDAHMTTHALRAFGCLLVSFAGAAASLADGTTAPPGGGDARSQFLGEHPGVKIYVNPEGISTVYGRAFSEGKSPEASAAAFVGQYAGMFNVAPEELLPIAQVGDGQSAWPLMFERDKGQYKFTQVHYTQ